MCSFTYPGIRKNYSFFSTPSSKGAVSPGCFLVRGFLLLFMVSFLSPFSFGQTSISQSKIDPVFRFIIDHLKETNALRQPGLFRHFNVEPTEGFGTKNASVEKRYECIVYTKNAKTLIDSGIIINSALPVFVTAWVTLDQIVQMSLMKEVNYIESPPVNYLNNDVAVANTGASLLHQGNLNNTVYKGKNVIVGIYDTGIDWDHFDFRYPDDTTRSRIIRIWDQTITARTGEAPPSGFTYGVEYTQNQISNELDGTPANVVRERDINGHGTHVAGTAAGNGSALSSKKYTGMAPEADIVVIKGGNTSFSESRMIDGLTYLKNLATTLGKPAVLNWSIGSQFGPHDGTRAYEVAADNFTSSAAGRVVVISAGNENGTNMHNHLNIPGNGAGAISFVVSDTTATDVFEYMVYANDNSDITATITSPDGSSVTAMAGQDISGKVLSDSFTVFLYNRIDPGNNNRYIDVYVAKTDTNKIRPTGNWILSLTNNTTNSLSMDGWLYYKNAAFSATTLIGGNNDYLVGSPGNAGSAITAASYVGKNNWYSNAVPGPYTYNNTRQDSISSFSSRGPRRDGVMKPDIAAQGEVVISSLSSDAVAAYNIALIAEPKLYLVLQGTSMAAPCISGAVALLLQANPGYTASQIKALLTSASNKDAMTELAAPTPNTTWGYGKLDVFKAASLLFNCAPADRRTYKYDSSTRNAQEVGTTFSTQRISVRFTPDMSGKLGGVYFHTSVTSTSLFIEVRSNSSGNPGALLGALNIDSTKIARYSFNYMDVSNLNISVTSGTDYFIVIGRQATSIANWSLRGETISPDGRSYQSLNGGSTWTVLGTDYKIRSVVYNNGQLAGAIAKTNSADARPINTSIQFINSNCELINQVVPNGVTPVSGPVTSSVWIESTVPHINGKPYVQRHYGINPAFGSSLTSGRVTLYFTLEEFIRFNNDALSTLDLPTGPSDAIGIANLRIGKYDGISSDSSGSPGSYGNGSVIDPADGDIVWNQAANRWEVSFDVIGFGAFIVQTSSSVLPLIMEYFRGNTQGTANLLNWKINCINSGATFEVERSNNGINFNSIGILTTTQADCSQPFNFKDVAPMPGNDYYRIKITGNTGNVAYTNTILLQNDKKLITRLFPNVLSKGAPVQVSLGSIRGNLTIYDAVGRQVFSRPLVNGVQSINLDFEGKSIYFYTIKDGNSILSAGKIIVE